MANKKSFFSRFKLVYRHSPLLLKCAVLVTIILSAAALTVLRVGITQYQDQKDAYRVQAAQIQQENQNMEEMIQQKDTVDGTKNIAREELGLVESDTVFYDIVTNQD